MKKIVIALGMIFSSVSAYSQESGPSIKLEQDEQSVTVFYSSEKRSSICPLVVTDVTISRGDAMMGKKVAGTIELSMERPFNSYCMMAIGPHRGSARFMKGQGLPQLVPGHYQVSVNGQKFDEEIVID